MTDKNKSSATFTQGASEKDFLQAVIEKLPGHVYWLNRDNVYLGCNELQAEYFGSKSPEAIIGRNNYELYNKKDAEELDRVNNRVMDSGETYYGEEIAISTTEGEVICLSQKMPLHNRAGKVIGLLGISFDISDRKRAEALEVENKTQQIRIEEQSKRQEVFKQVAHDIQSPLLALKMLPEACMSLQESEYKILKSVIYSIQGIVGRMLNEEDTSVSKTEESDSIAVCLVLEEVLVQKRYQYKDKAVQFKLHCDVEYHETFIHGNHSTFTRMLSNLINNAVEAFEGKAGVVDLKVSRAVDRIQILIKDSGKGMPQSMIEDILNNVLIGTTKKEGHGIGLRQIRDALQSLNGTMQIESQEGVGTTFCLEFPTIEKPDWILEELILNPENTLVILDDDSSMHQSWNLRLKAIADKVKIKYFKEGREAIEFTQAAPDKGEIIFLTDYDLRDQKLNGIEVIQQIGQVGQVVIFTSNYLDPEVRKFIKLEQNIKVLPKQFIPNLPTFLEKTIADIVWLDDDAMLVKIAKSRARDMGLSMDIYTQPKFLLDNLSKYPKNTKFIFDHEFKEDIDGFKLAEKLYKEGYTNFCLFSGTKFLEQMIPHYLKVSYKGTVRNIDTLMSL